MSHTMTTATIPVSTSISNNNLHPSQYQLSRSKSLNDITNDSQIAPFVSDRFINLKQQQVGGDDCCFIIPGDLHSTYSPVLDASDFCILQQQQQQQQQTSAHHHHALHHHQQMIPTDSTSNNISNNNNNNLTFNESRNLINLTVTSQQAASGACSRPPAANVFGMCSPLVANMSQLNGVTEQIGNLHL